MGVATVLIGLLPTYLQIGLWSPVMLAIMRFCQGMGLGGEWSGASLLAGENARPGKRGFDSMWPQLGAPIGFLLANGFFLILTLTMHYDSTTATIPASGWLGDKLGRKSFLTTVTALIMVFGMTFGFFLNPERVGTGAGAHIGRVLVFMLIGMALMGLTFGIQSALLPELFPTNVRYTGSAIAYNVASILGASVASFVATWLAGKFGPGSVGVYLLSMGACTLIACVTTPETKDRDLSAFDAETASVESEPVSVPID